MHAVIIIFFMFSPPIYGRIIYVDQGEIPIAVNYGVAKLLLLPAGADRISCDQLVFLGARLAAGFLAAGFLAAGLAAALIAAGFLATDASATGAASATGFEAAGVSTL
jgi:hypothetical protein